MNKVQNILIFAGGESSRFWPLCEKNLFIFGGKTLLEHHISTFTQMAENIIIVGNRANKGRIETIAKKYGATVTLQEGAGQAAAILSAKNLLLGSTIILNGADIFDPHFIKSLIQKQQETSCDLAVTARHVKTYFPGGYFKLDGDSVVDIIEKPGREHMPSSYFRLVVELYADMQDFISVIGTIKSDRDDIFEKALSKYIDSKQTKLVLYKGGFAGLKYPWHVLDVSNYYLKQLKSHIGVNVNIDPTARLIGDIYIEDGVKIHEYSKIVGPAYIGENTIIGNYALVLASMIGEKCVIGGYSEVTRSYLGDNVWLHRNYIGDSVLEGDNLLGAHAVTANYRFDKQAIRSQVKGELVETDMRKLGAVIGRHARIGVQSTLMPGIKIGASSLVMPGLVVKRDIDR